MELWERGERETCRIFSLWLTSGSGRGHDKGDSKNEEWMAETKTTEAKSFPINFDKFREWRRNASRTDKLFFVHIIPIIDKELKIEDSLCATHYRTLLSLMKDLEESKERIKELEAYIVYIH